MSGHIRDDRLHDYVDDLLCREERAEVELHLVTCTHCQREVARLRDMLAALAALPAAVPPARDLLPGVHAGIAVAGARRRWRAGAVAAAAAVVVVAGALAVRLADEARRAPGATAAAPGAPAAVAVQGVEAPYIESAAELERLLARNRATLRPETVRVIEENLAVVDRALAEARAALRDDPGNPVLEQILVANHRTKLELLRGAARAGT